MPYEQNETTLLSRQEREACATVVAKNIARVSQRAQALLLIDEGQSQAETVQKTGLTIGQVRYAILRFKKIGLAMFPSDLTEKSEPQDLAPTEKKPKVKKIKKKEKKKKQSGKKLKTKKDKKKSKNNSPSKKKKSKKTTKAKKKK